MIFVNKFFGRVPKIDPKLLPLGFAQEATNVDLRTGSIEPMKGLTQVQEIAKTGDIRSIYKIDDTWIYWTAIVEVVKAQVLNGDYRIFFTGDGYPKQTNKTLATSGAASTYPTETRRYGVIAPAAALTLETQGSGDGEVVDSVSYVYTYVTAFGEESAPCPATVVQDIEGSQYVRLKNFVIPVLATTGNDVEYFRLYRLASGTTGAEYQLVKARPGAYSATAVYDIPVTDVPNTSTYVYDCDSPSSPAALNDDLSDDLPSQDWDDPPATLAGLVQFQNGILAGFDADELCVSEPLIYYAMPEDYKPTINNIVAIGVHNEAMIVGTNDFPWLVIGNDPATLMARILSYNQKCLSKRGMVSTNIGVLYPTPDGLFLVDQAQGIVLTADVYKKEQWAALTPENLISFYYDDKYYGFFQGTGTGFIFDFKNEPFVQTISIATDLFYGGYVDPVGDTLYMLVKTGSDYNIKSWGTGSNATGIWKSPVHESAELTNYGWARISGDYATTKGTDIAFVDGGAGNDSITQVAAGFVAAGYIAGDEFVVSGSGSNDGTYTILTVVAGTIEVATGSLTSETAGESVTLSKPVTFKLYADGELKQTKTVTSSEFFRLLAGYEARKWEFEVSGKAKIDSVFIGHTKEEAP